MKEVILALIGHLNSSVIVLFLILIAAFVMLYKVGGWTEKFSNHEKKVEKLEELSRDVVSLSTKIDLIYQFTNPNRLLQSNSPISLSPIGEELSNKIEANKIFQKYSEKLIALVEETSPNNAYDIQKSSLEVTRLKMLDMLDEKDLIKIKQEAFNKGILVEDILGIFGILLRNHILAKGGMPLADVDRYDPMNSK